MKITRKRGEESFGFSLRGGKVCYIFIYFVNALLYFDPFLFYIETQLFPRLFFKNLTLLLSHFIKPFGKISPKTKK